MTTPPNDSTQSSAPQSTPADELKAIFLTCLLDSLIALDPGVKVREDSSLMSVKISESALLKVMTLLKQDSRFDFDQLQFHTVLDWPEEQRMECLYLLNSTKKSQELLISVSVSREKPQLPSVSKLWAIAEWQEREVYDMFGITYENHPDLRRIFLDDDWQGFPLRKDYQDEFMLRKPW